MAGSGLLGWVLCLADLSWWQKVLFVVLGVTPLMSMANAAFRADVRRGQRRRDAAATRILATVRAGGTAPAFSLYLRPFVTTDRMAAQPVPPEIGSGHQVPVHLDTETLLARALRERCPLVALGRPGDIMEGAARITSTDDDWQAVMTLLAERAEFIVMTPLARAGTLRELAWLVRHDLLDKVVMVMPETVGEAPSGVVHTTAKSARLFDTGVQTWDPEPHRIDRHAEWRAATAAATAYGVTLPPQAAVGALFTVDPADGSVARILPLALSPSARRVRYVREALTALRTGGATAVPPVPELLARATAYRGATLEFALLRAADGFLLWSSPATAAELMERALREGARTGSHFVDGYLDQLPALVAERLKLGDTAAVAAYRAGAPALLRSSTLTALAPAELVERLSAAAEPPSAGTQR